MKNVLKRITSVFLAITIIFSSAYVGLGEVDFSGIFAVKSKAVSENDLTFQLNEDGESYSVSDCNSSANGVLVIPSTYTGKPVTSIGYAAFRNCDGITSITIPDSVTSIGSLAFENTAYYNNENNWENDVLYIGNHLIKAKDSLSGDYVVKAGTKTVADSAFSLCDGLTSIEIPDGVTNIGASAFFGCDSLKYVTLPDTITKIGERAFGFCSDIEVVYIPSIASWCNIDFENYESNPLNDAKMFNNVKLFIDGDLPTVIEIPDGVTKIPSCTFINNDNLVSIDIPESVTDIGTYAFDGCSNLISVVIPNGVTSIGYGTFRDCKSLTSVELPDTVTSIGSNAFEYCESLTSINISDGVTSIGGGAFSLCKSLTSINIPDGITSIGDYTFKNCESLTSITIPDSVTSIGDDAFYFCRSLTSVVIPDSVKSLGSSAFTFCDSLISVKIGKGLITMGEYPAFSYCEKLVEINVDKDNTAFSSVDGVLFNKKQTKLIKYPAGKTDSTYIIPDTVTSFDSDVFGYSSVKTIVFGKNISVISGGMFSNCSKLENIVLPVKVKNIASQAFWSCGISDVFYEGSQEEWGSVTIGNDNTCLTKARVHYNVGATEWENHFSEPTIDKKPSCYFQGTEKSTCACGYEKTESVPATGHKAGSWTTTVKATENNAGKRVKKCVNCSYVFESETIPQLKCSKPKLSKIENTTSGVKITWGKVTGADKYDVYRKTGSSGKYSKIGTTSKTYYTDKKASSGKKYYYYVKAVNEAGASSASSSKSIYYLADTTLSTPKSTKSGITLKWKKVTGADGYLIYRKTGSGSYSKIATVKGNSKVTYTDKSAKKGKTYTYKIKAYKSKTYSAYSNTKKIKDKY